MKKIKTNCYTFDFFQNILSVVQNYNKGKKYKQAIYRVVVQIC